MAKQAKFKVFAYETEQGKVGTINAPASKVTEKTALMYASHWILKQINMDLDELGDKVLKIVGVK